MGLDILDGLRREISSITLTPPVPTDPGGLARLKGHEDMLDALVCAWVGAQYLAGAADPYGNDETAIWVPIAPHSRSTEGAA